MALRALMLRKKLNEKTKKLEELRAVVEELEKREAELETAIEEAETEEEKTAVEEEVAQFEADKAENEEATAKLEEEVRAVEKELAEVEAAAPAPAKEPEAPTTEANNDQRGEIKTMETRKFYGMNMQERDAFMANEDVKAFLGEVRSCISEKRALTNAGLAIPQVMLPLIRTKVEEASKLIGKVNLVRVSGTGRARIIGAIPEAVWTEMCANLNELALTFYDDEVDGYKVGGFIPVCNAILEDNDIDLASVIIDAIGKAIGKALDKAIVYGTGVKMPVGIVTRLAETVQPAGYSATARPWADLSATHVITGQGSTGIALFKELVTETGVIDNDYTAGGLVWLMNAKTHNKLKVQSMDKNSNALIVAGMDNTMPLVGGEIVELSFIPDDNVVFGYFDAYLLAERAGTQLSQSEHVRFTADQTVFKGTARYDGHPAIAEAFAVATITSAAPTTSVTFPTDTAN